MKASQRRRSSETHHRPAGEKPLPLVNYSLESEASSRIIVDTEGRKTLGDGFQYYGCGGGRRVLRKRPSD